MSLRLLTLLFYGFVCTSGVLPSAVSGNEMVSEEYRVYGQGVGGTQMGVLESEQYVLTPAPGGAHTYGEAKVTLPPPHQGSRSNTITQVPAVTEVVRAALSTPRGNGPLASIEAPILLRQNVTGVDDTEVIGDAFSLVNTPPQKIKGNGDQQASLIYATFQHMDSLKVLLHNLFKTQSARMTFFVCVLMVLFLVRTYTSVGKKYRPF